MSFVKFSRGLLSTYEQLTRKDNDTLYLVYESNDAKQGKLYLGDKLISNVGSSSSLSLNDLTDVTISEELEDGMLLQYNGSTGQGYWNAVPLSEITSNLPAEGFNKISIVSALADISNPKNKDIAIVDNNVYIYNNGNWEQLTDSVLADRISSLETQIGHKANEDKDIPATGLYKDIADLKANVYTKDEIANLSHLRYQVVENLEAINVKADDASTTIYLVPNNKNDGYDEYFVINETLEKIGDLDVDLNEYVKTSDPRLLTQIQQAKIDSLGIDENNKVTIQTSQVVNLDQAIKDNQLIKSVEAGTFEVTSQGQLQLKSVPSIDLTGYVQTIVFETTVGNLNDINNRVSENSSIVEEINSIKESISWKKISGEDE